MPQVRVSASGPVAVPVLLVAMPFEELGDPAIGDVLPAVEALGVPAQEDGPRPCLRRLMRSTVFPRL
ncbi:hypothetical protein AB0J81_11440 [Streptomyces bobili]|uniref:hypothetical protein n=1 Tax=Streptomyces bobili TaxID=67280 RepID=UPI00341C2347